MRRGRGILFSAVGIMMMSTGVCAQTLRADMDFSFLFDNRELSSVGEHFKPYEYQTLTGAALTPWIGAEYSSGKASHRLMLGADLFREYGQDEKVQLWTETMFYWQSIVRLRREGQFTITAGIYPRTTLKGNYSRAFFSDETYFYDRNLEGVLMQWRRPKFNAELGLDWSGLRRGDTREKFQIMSAGEYTLLPWLHLGWSASMFHLASSEHFHSVVDNSMVEPWAIIDLGGATAMDALSLKVGEMVAYQRDRILMKHPCFPKGTEFTFTARKWNIEFSDNLYVGDNILPFYDSYQNTLYLGDSFYKLDTEGGKAGYLNRADLNFVKSFESGLSLRAGVTVYNANNGYYGWQQRVSIRYRLNNIRRNKGNSH